MSSILATLIARSIRESKSSANRASSFSETNTEDMKKDLASRANQSNSTNKSSLTFLGYLFDAYRSAIAEMLLKNIRPTSHNGKICEARVRNNDNNNKITQ